MIKKKIPLRKCVSCGERKPKKELIRIVRTPEGAVIDPTGKADGRGCYICRAPECIKAAKKGRRIEKALEISGCDELYDSICTVTVEE